MKDTAQEQITQEKQHAEFYLTNILSLTNILGLITRKSNKCQFLKEIAGNKQNRSQVIAVTEIWTKTVGHHDAEILRSFPGYVIMRSDRDTDGEDHLASREWCLLLASPDIIITLILTFSNGYCEILVAELPELLEVIIRHSENKNVM